MTLRANAAAAPTAPKGNLWRLHAHSEGAIRRDNYRGKEHLVVPIVALVEGVIQCSTCPQPELALAAEFGKVAAAWNGRPVTIPHPNEGGVPVSAGAPAIMEQFGVGWIFNARVEESKLHLEAWIDPEMAANVAEGPRLLERLEALESGQSSEQIEVSTGYFTQTVPTHGRWNGVAYYAVQRDIKPDHLAILREAEQGACSWENGCGVRAAAERAPNLVAACACGGAADPHTRTRTLDDYTTKLQAIEARSQAHAVPRAGQLHPNATGISYEDLRTAVRLRLADELDGDLFAVHAVFQDAVIYERWSTMKIWERPWSMQGDQIVLGDGEIQVRPETRFIPVTATSVRQNVRRGTDMTKQERIDGLVANAKTRYEESDRQWLETLSEEQLEKLEPAEEKPADPEPEKDADPDPAKAAEPTNPPATLTREQLAAAAKAQGLELVEPNSAEQEIRDEALALHAQRRKDLVAGLTAQQGFPYSKAELEKMPLRELQRLAKVAKLETQSATPDFSGRGMPARPAGENEDPLGDRPRTLAEQVGTRSAREKAAATA